MANWGHYPMQKFLSIITAMLLASSVGASAQTPAQTPDVQAELRQTKAQLAFVTCVTTERPRDQSLAVCLRKLAKDHAGTAAAAAADARIDMILADAEAIKTPLAQPASTESIPPTQASCGSMASLPPPPHR